MTDRMSAFDRYDLENEHLAMRPVGPTIWQRPGERILRQRIAAVGWDEYMTWLTDLAAAGKEYHAVGWGSRLRPRRNLRLIHEDRTGKLWTFNVGPVLIRVVEVINATADKRGEQQHYFIPVDRYLRPIGPHGFVGKRQRLTARNAVASTFGLRGGQYRVGAAS